MALAETVRTARSHRILLEGQEVEWRLVRSPTAKKLRIKVGTGGVVVVLPKGRDDLEASAFVSNQRAWVAAQLKRISQLHTLRRPSVRDDEGILFRGKTVAVRVVRSPRFRSSAQRPRFGIVPVSASHSARKA